MRENPQKIEEYWKDLRNGRTPEEFVNRLRTQGFEFAMELKSNREFKDFARNIPEMGMNKLLEDLRTNL